MAAAAARLVQGGPSRHRHRARDQPPERRPGAARLRRLARLFGRDLRTAPADPARGHAAGGDPLRGGAAAGVQPGAAGRPRPAPQPGPAARLAAALRSRLGRRLVLLVRPPGPAHPGPLAGLRLPPLLDAGPGGGERARGRHRSPDADRPRARTPDPGAALRPPAGGARALLPDHHRRLAAAARAAGVPERGSCARPRCRRPPPRAFRATPDPAPGAASPQRARPSGASESQDPRLSA